MIARTRTLLVCVLGLIMVWPVPTALAQAYPSKPIRLIVPFSPGGTSDALARPLAQRLGDALGTSVIVENRPGALTVIGAEMVAKAPPDGYTLYFMPGTHVLIPFMVKSVPFKPIDDFTPIGTIGYLPYILLANANRPYKTLPQLIDYARAHPEDIPMGVSDAVTQVAASSLQSAANAKFTTVMYKGGGPLGTDLVGNHIGAAVGAANLLPFVKEGKLIPLAVTTPKRAPFLPDVPTIAETIPGSAYDVQTWYAIVGPAHLPREIVQRLYSEMRKILAEPHMRTLLDDFGMVSPDDSSPAATAALMTRYQSRMSKLVEAAGIKPQ
jgi:tripartite-type tricarboxylate transporter receptor subunit TctC